MKVSTPPRTKYFTVQEANSTLPLIRAIVEDITELAHLLRDWHERLSRCLGGSGLSQAHQEEVDHSRVAFQRRYAELAEYEEELARLGVQLKDYFLGLIDFPARLNGREVFLCWRLGEPEVTHWHALQAAASRQQVLRLALH